MDDAIAVTLMHKKATLSLPSFFEPIGPTNITVRLPNTRKKNHKKGIEV